MADVYDDDMVAQRVEYDDNVEYDWLDDHYPCGCCSCCGCLCNEDWDEEDDDDGASCH